MISDAQKLACRYADIWNEPYPNVRATVIAELWRPDGVHCVRKLHAQGYQALQQRITDSHNKNVRDGDCRFRAVSNAQQVQNVITFNWEMLRPNSDEVAAVGLEFIELDASGRIVSDYMFFVS